MGCCRQPSTVSASAQIVSTKTPKAAAMSKETVRNRPLRCVQELNDFDVAMGWAFRDLSLHDETQCQSPDQSELEREHRELKRREHTHTAFDERVEIPREFVAPTSGLRTKQSTPANHHKKTKKTAVSMVSSAAYSKRPTSKRPPAKPTPAPRHSATRDRSRSRSPERQEEVDFVYDVDTRRKLRERMDAERMETLHKAVEKEAKLRAEHKWVRDDQPPSIKQAWQAADKEDARPASPTDRPRRFMSAGSSTSRTSGTSSLSSSTATKTGKALSSKTSIAPHLSEWRTQQFPVYASVETELSQRRRVDVKRQQQRRVDASEVARTIAAFEQSLKQWTS